MDEIIIKSSKSSASIRFHDKHGEYFLTTVSSVDYSATIKVWSYTDSAHLVDLFQSMALDWRGWTGNRSWESIEGELHLDCSHDRLGHITLCTCLRMNDGVSDAWSIKCIITTEAGQLDKIARDITSFFNGQSNHG